MNRMEETASSHLGQSRHVPSIDLTIIKQGKEKFLGWKTIDLIGIHIHIPPFDVPPFLHLVAVHLLVRYNAVLKKLSARPPYSLSLGEITSSSVGCFSTMCALGSSIRELRARLIYDQEIKVSTNGSGSIKIKEGLRY